MEIEALQVEVRLVAKAEVQEALKELSLEARLAEPLIKVLVAEAQKDLREVQVELLLPQVNQVLVTNQQELQAEDLKDLLLRVPMLQKNSVLKKSSKLFLDVQNTHSF